VLLFVIWAVVSAVAAFLTLGTHVLLFCSVFSDIVLCFQNKLMMVMMMMTLELKLKVTDNRTVGYSDSWVSSCFWVMIGRARARHTRACKICNICGILEVERSRNNTVTSSPVVARVSRPYCIHQKASVPLPAAERKRFPKFPEWLQCYSRYGNAAASNATINDALYDTVIWSVLVMFTSSNFAFKIAAKPLQIKTRLLWQLGL